jgi:dihydrodipicolinate synthase/N-acetylneuraminate lyase
MLLEGLHLPLLTPFYPDGRLNLRKMEHNVERYSRTPVSALVALSEAGEPGLLSDFETSELLGIAMGAAADSKVMIAGVSRGSVSGTLGLAEVAAVQKYDAVLVKRPEFLREGQSREVLTYLQSVADRSPLPVILYSTTASNLPLNAIAELAAHPQVIGLVDENATSVEAFRNATTSVRREVTVTTVFAAATGDLCLGRIAGRRRRRGDRSSHASPEDSYQDRWVSDRLRKRRWNADRVACWCRGCDAWLCGLRSSGLL